MTEKQEKILQEIKKFYQDNNAMPSIRYLKNKLHYKSTNTIYKHLISLENNGYLVRNNLNKLVITNIDSKIRSIKIINSPKKISLLLKNSDKYVGFQFKNNYLLKQNINKGDILIIKKNIKLKNHDLGLFLIDNQFQILEYSYNNGFYILKGENIITLYKVKIIGKVVMVERHLT